MVRQLLGNKGSYATIADELKHWQADRGYELANPAVQATELLGATHATELIAQAADLSQDLAAAVAAARDSAAVMARLPAELAAIQADMAALAKAVELVRAAMRQEVVTSKEQVAMAHERYAGVQKYAMLAIEAARSEARMLSEQMAATADKTGARESAYRRQSEDLRVIVHELQNRLAGQGKRLEAGDASAG